MSPTPSRSGTGVDRAVFRSLAPLLLAVVLLAALAGAAFALPGARVSVVSAIGEALRGGGLSQPPVAFDPGWRFLLVAVAVLLGSAATALALAFARPRLAVAAGGALAAATLLTQPANAEVVSVVGAVGLLAGALAAGYTAVETTARRFELYRLGRAALAVVVLGGALVVIGHLDALFPATHRRQVVPPHRPESAPSERDRVLFRVDASEARPWRLGVLDGYDGRAWLTPPYDTDRFRAVRGDGRVSGANATSGSERVSFRVADLGGHVLPAAAGLTRVTGVRGAAVDPRTGVVRVAAHVVRHVRYTIELARPPTGDELAAAPDPPAAMRPFLRAPRPPAAVAELVTAAQQGAGATSGFARLQAVRTAYYSQVVAAGPGTPHDVTPSRVAQMLRGDPASPFEITAGEALLARWAGIPSRIGYGWFGGTATTGGFEVRPIHGATWLEAWFRGYGWVPIVGRPPQARASLSRNRKNPDAAVRPSDRLALTVYVPVRLHTVQAVYTVARYWTVRALGVIAAVAALVLSVPALRRVVRRRRRARWARAHGGPERVAVAYAELRDTATDLGVGATVLTPIEMTAVVGDDDEHEQLAWLVTRALWGDLRRDLHDRDVVVCEQLARSVGRRLRKGQALSTRLSAYVSRASLRDPYSADVPGASVSRRVVAVGALIGLVVSGATSAAVAATTRSDRAPATLVAVARTRPLPDAITLAGFTVQREPSAERAFRRTASAVRGGRVWSVHDADTVEASLQSASFAPGVSGDAPEVRRAVVRAIGGADIRLARLGTQRVYTLEQPEQHIVLWFAPDGGSYLVLVARAAFAGADDVFTAALARVRGEQLAPGAPPYDPRRGDDS